jgi:hypothetical protein
MKSVISLWNPVRRPTATLAPVALYSVPTRVGPPPLTLVTATASLRNPASKGRSDISLLSPIRRPPEPESQATVYSGRFENLPPVQPSPSGFVRDQANDIRSGSRTFQQIEGAQRTRTFSANSRHYHGRRATPTSTMIAEITSNDRAPNVPTIGRSAPDRPQTVIQPTIVLSNAGGTSFSLSRTIAVLAGKLLLQVFGTVPIHNWELATALQESCTSFLRSRPSLHAMSAKRKITKSGKFLDVDQIKTSDILRAACKLAPLLSPTALIKAFGLTGLQELLDMGVDQIRDLVIKIAASKQPSTINGAFSAYAQLLSFARSLNPTMELSNISGFVISKFLNEVDLAAKERASYNAARKKKKLVGEGDVSHGAVVHDGHSVLSGVTAGLKFMEARFGVNLSATSSLVQASGRSTANPSKKQVHSTSLFVMIHLEMMATNPILSHFVRARQRRVYSWDYQPTDTFTCNEALHFVKYRMMVSLLEILQ